MSQNNCDFLIVGAGPVGSVSARILAEAGFHCTVLDRRNHIAGNCYDETDEHGVLIHKYGPHYFRTNNDDLIDFLSRFTDWVPGTYIVKSKVGDKLYPFPINIDTLESYFDVKLDEKSAEEYLKKLQIDPGHEARNSEEFVLSRVGKELYEKFYLGYTLKQWDKHPKDLAASVCGRIPVRFNRYDRYVDHKFQMLPKHGFTRLFQNIITHPKIDLKLGVDFIQSRDEFNPKHATIYTGAVDEYFECKLGTLPWRSLEFEFKNFKEEYVQPCVQINYAAYDVPHTRTVEIKHATGQKLPSTTISYEYPKAKGDPYYPIPSPESAQLYEKYKELANQEAKNNNVHFIGRLAEYTYINTDQAIEKGFEIAQKLLDEASDND